MVIELAPDLAGGDLLVAAALHLLPPSLDLALVLSGVEDPTAADAQRLTETCARIGGVGQRSVELMGETEARSSERLAWVTGSSEPRATATAIANLAAVTFALTTSHSRSPEADDVEACAMLRRRDALALERDGLRRTNRPMIAVIAQVQSTWPAVDSIVRMLMQRDDLDVEIVAVESTHEAQDQTTADFLADLGLRTRDVRWLEDELRDSTSPLAAALFYDPWDGLRPEAARSQTVAAYGVRIAYVPYGTNVGAGTSAESYAYNLPMHQLASRIYARSEIQRAMFEEHCAYGAEHVRILGVPKFDRMRDLAPQVRNGQVTVLWNPHFSVEPGGWSTFIDYLDEILTYAEKNSDVTIIVRPHFRLLRDAPLAGGELHAKVQHLMEAPQRLPNVEIDTAPDYAETFARADVMISDLSSLFPEFLVTGKPILYLHRADSPGVNRDAQYFFEGSVALDWSGVDAFLADAQAGRDGGRVHRELTISRHFEHLDGKSSSRIAEDISQMIPARSR